jgi:hypothetical protein
MTFLDDAELERALHRFCGLRSVFNPERVCLVTWDIPTPDLEGRANITVHRATPKAPWFRRQLAALLPWRKRVVELASAENVVDLTTQSEDVTFYSFGRALLPAVISSASVDIGSEDPTYGELCIHSDLHTRYWIVWSKHNSQCPADLAALLSELR